MFVGMSELIGDEVIDGVNVFNGLTKTFGIAILLVGCIVGVMVDEGKLMRVEGSVGRIYSALPSLNHRITDINITNKHAPSPTATDKRTFLPLLNDPKYLSSSGNGVMMLLVITPQFMYLSHRQ